MATVQSPLQGGAELSVKLKGMKTKMQLSILKKALRQAIKPAVAQARATAPVDTGLTKKSVRTKVQDKRDKRGASAILGVLRRAYYALYFVERGTSRFPARPWLVPAFEATRNAQLSTLIAALKTEILKAAQKGK